MSVDEFGVDWGEMDEEIKKDNTSGSKDPRLFEPKKTTDNRGIEIAQAVIRFLPQKPGTIKLPYAKRRSHGWKNGALFKGFTCPRTNNGKCPICDKLNNEWNELPEGVRKKYKFNTYYYSNIIVLNDPITPDNNGKIFVLKYPKTIFEKIENLLNPSNSVTKKMNVFHYAEGANFTYLAEYTKKIGNQKVPTYENSSFGNPSVLFDGNKESLQKVMSNLHDISEFYQIDKIPSEEEMNGYFSMMEKDIGSNGGEVAMLPGVDMTQQMPSINNDIQQNNVAAVPSMNADVPNLSEVANNSTSLKLPNEGLVTTPNVASQTTPSPAPQVNEDVLNDDEDDFLKKYTS